MHESFARTRTTELDREIDQIIRTRTPMHDRPGQQPRGLQRVGSWLAEAGVRLGGPRAPLPAGAELTRLTIRPALPLDEPDLNRLAELDERRVPTGYVLVAERDDSIIAALPVHGGHAVTDPRLVTADVVELLELRSRQLRESGLELVATAA